MTERAKRIGIFIGFLGIAFGVYVWFYPLNKGKLSFEVNLTGYQVSERDAVFPCPENPCVIPFKSGLHILEIKKEGYLSERVAKQVRRGSEETVSVELKKIPSLEISEIIPTGPADTKKLPTALQSDGIRAATWDNAGVQAVYLDKSTGKVQLIKEEKELKTITVLKGAGEFLSFYWAPNNEYLVGLDGESLYFIDSTKGSRKKEILEFVSSSLRWSPDSAFFLINDAEHNLYQIHWNGRTVTPLQMKLNLAQAVFLQADELIYYEYDEEAKKTTVNRYDALAGVSETILNEYDFPVSEIRAQESKAYLYNSHLERWYELK